MDDAFEHRLHGIKVDLGNGVELMVVAAGAPNRQAKEGGTGDPYHVGQFVGPLLLPEQRIFAAHDILGASHQKTGGGVLAQGVPGNLLEHELVVGLVLVECPNDIVAVVVGIGPLVVGLEAGAVGIAYDVQPMAGPAFTVTWVLENFFNQLLVGVLSCVRNESFYFLGCRNQSQHVQVHPANQNARGRLSRLLQSFFRKPFRNEFVDTFPG